jgi:hypothetical protein
MPNKDGHRRLMARKINHSAERSRLKLVIMALTWA